MTRKEGGNVSQKIGAQIKIALVIVILLFPIAFLLFRTGNYLPGSAGNRQIALEQLEETARAYPSIGNYINLSHAYINDQQPEKALEPLRKAIAQDPGSAVAYNNLGVAYNLLKRYDEGIAACRKAIELDPNFQLARNNLRWGLDERAKLRRGK